MTFTVTYRGADGVLREERVDGVSARETEQSAASGGQFPGIMHTNDVQRAVKATRNVGRRTRSPPSRQRRNRRLLATCDSPAHTAHRMGSGIRRR